MGHVQRPESEPPRNDPQALRYFQWTGVVKRRDDDGEIIS